MISKHALKAAKKSLGLLAGLLKSCIFAGHFSGGQLYSRLILKILLSIINASIASRFFKEKAGARAASSSCCRKLD